MIKEKLHFKKEKIMLKFKEIWPKLKKQKEEMQYLKMYQKFKDMLANEIKMTNINKKKGQKKGKYKNIHLLF